MDELRDEVAVAGDDAAVGAALLMADLEGAIAAAGDEIASLRRVTEAVPRPGLPPGQVGGGDVAPQPLEAELARTSPETADVAPAMPDEVLGQAVAEPLSRGSIEPVATRALPERTAPVGAPALTLDRAAPMLAAQMRWPMSGAQAGGQPDPLPASVASLPSMPGLTASAPVPRSLDRSPAPNAVAPRTASVEGATTGPTAPVSPVAPASAQQERDFAEHAVPEQPASPLDAAPVSPAAPVRLPGASVRDAAGVAPSTAIASAGERDGEAPSQDTARSGPTEGDVYLDGERVGRWMARHLARELGGPQAAGTGFDPRLGPTWPGSMHGN